MNDKYTSRFITTSDAQTDSMIFKLRSTWWSRFYEYYSGSIVKTKFMG